MRVRTTLVVVGAVVMAYALLLLLTGGRVTAPLQSGVWIVGAALTHDLVLAPVVALVGLLLAHVVPVAVRAVVAGGLIVIGALVLVSIPVLLDRGGQGNVTTTPLNYPRGLLLSVVTVAVLTGALAVRAARKRRPPVDQEPSSS